MELHLFHHMHSTELTDHHATAYQDTRKQYNCVFNCATAYHIFRQGKAIQNDVMATTCHIVVTTSYPLLHAVDSDQQFVGHIVTDAAGKVIPTGGMIYCKCMPGLLVKCLLHSQKVVVLHLTPIS